MKNAVSVTKSKGKILISIDEKNFDGDFKNIKDLVNYLISENHKNKKYVNLEDLTTEIDPDNEFDCGMSFREFLQMEIQSELYKNKLLKAKSIEEITKKISK